MLASRFPFLLDLGTGASGRWRLWALFAFVALVAAFGTWISGQYKIGRLDVIKNQYNAPVTNFASQLAVAQKHSLEFDMLQGCKQSQIGSWLQTTDALQFRGPITGNRIEVSLREDKAFLDLNGREISVCVQDDIEDMQFDIGSMVNTWSVVLVLISFCLGVWSWVCYYAQTTGERKARNIYAETLAETVGVSTDNGVTSDLEAGGAHKEMPDQRTEELKSDDDNNR